MKIAVGGTVTASLYRDKKAVRGKITFLDDGVLFFPCASRFRLDDAFIPYDQIAEIKKQNTLSFLPNGLTIITGNGMEYRFTVYKRDEVANFLSVKSVGDEAAAVTSD